MTGVMILTAVAGLGVAPAPPAPAAPPLVAAAAAVEVGLPQAGQKEKKKEKARRVGEERGEGGGPKSGRGDGPPGHARGRKGDVDWRGSLTPRLERLLEADRAGARSAAVALATGRARGLDDETLDVRLMENGVRVIDGEGRILLDLDDERARRLGGWDVVRTDARRVREGAPAFCRSGEGHPVWGRDWCLEKGFGLGSDGDLWWGRSSRVEDIVFRSPRDRRELTLRDILDDVVLDRLALHALTLGADEPLVGFWLGEPEGPRVLRLEAGGLPVAELVDYDRDDGVDALLVSLR